MDLDKLKVFYMVAKTGKFTKAADALNLTQPALTRSIQLLEHSLKTKLFDRSHTGVLLTSSGERLYEFAKRFIDEAEIVSQLINDYADEPQGDLRVITTPGMASLWLTEFIPGFLKKHPEINFDIIGTFSDLEKHAGRTDILIRTYMSHQPHLVQRCVMSSPHKLWASPEYLQKFGIPQKVDELDHHRLLTFEKASFNALANNTWILEKGSNITKPRKPYLTINSLEGLINCANKGLGIIGMPEKLIKLKNTNLINILKDVEGPLIDIYCIYSEKMKKSKKVTLFADYLEQLMKEEAS